MLLSGAVGTGQPSRRGTVRASGVPRSAHSVVIAPEALPARSPNGMRGLGSLLTVTELRAGRPNVARHQMKVSRSPMAANSLLRTTYRARRSLRDK